MISRLLLFVTIFVLVFGGSNYALYYSAIRFFNISNPTYRTYFIVALVALCLSFFFSSFLIRLHGNILTNIYYAFSAYWIGLLANLIVACGIMWIVIGIMRLIGNESYLPTTSAIVFSFVFLFSIYGIWHATVPVAKNIDITLKNLPAEWKGKKIVQLSDVHLGPILRVGFLNKVVAKVNELKPDLVLITGDLFDGMDGDLEPFIKPLSEFKSTYGTYFVTGNHEGYLGLDTSLGILKQTNIKVLDDQVVDIKGLQIVGISYPLYDQANDAEKAFASKDYDPKKPTILMYHVPMNVTHKNNSLSHQQWTSYFSMDTDYSFAEEHGVDLQLSGHTHEGQFFPFNIVTRLLMGKNYYGLHTYGTFNIYTTSGVGTWGPPMRMLTNSEIPVFTLR
jgi:hypothetical protein